MKMKAASHLDVLSDEVCRHLLTNEQMGRIAFVDTAGYPVVLPVNYVVDGDFIVFRTDAGAKLDQIPLQRVAFEVEHLAPACRSGWSVLVQGWSQDLTDAAGSAFEQLRRRSIGPWAPGEKAHWLAVEIRHISGRRIRPPG
jgi:uncharacterized protein